MHALILLLLALSLPAFAQRRVALTFDDLPCAGASLNPAELKAMTEQFLNALDQAHAPALAFVNGEKLEVDREARLAALRAWTARHHPLGNHTYSHPNLDETPLLSYESDILRNHDLLAPLLKEAGQTQLWFRHPFTHTGADAQTKQALEAFLTHRQYRVAPFTVEQSDWLFNAVYEKADEPLRARIRAAYLELNDQAFAWFERLSRETLGYEVRQILLLHANRLNAAVLPEMLERLRARGYQFISVEDALRDQAYLRLDTFTGRNGPSYLHRWAISAGQPNRIAEDPDPPAWVLQAYKELPR